MNKSRSVDPHCNVIIGRNHIEANANTDEIQLLGNPRYRLKDLLVVCKIPIPYL